MAPGLSFHFYGMTFVDASVGYAYGGVGWRDGEFETPGRIYKTTDGGLTWALVHESAGWKIGMACWDRNHCWAGGKWGRVVFTEDGGATWRQAATYTWADPPAPTPTPSPFTAWIRSAATTRGVGSPVFFGATDNVILRSTDGWQFNNIWPLLPISVATWGMSCPTASTCYGGQIQGWIVKTTDGGLNWEYTWLERPWENCREESAESIQRRYYGLDFLNQNWGWAVGSCGAIHKTGNGGAGWFAKNGNVSVNVQFRAVRMIDYSQAIAVGGENPMISDSSMAQNAVVYVTTDGEHWQPVAAPETDELHGMGAFGMTGVVVADWAGNIWRKDGSVLQQPPGNTRTPTVTATATPTTSPTTTATATSTPTSTPTTTATPSTGTLRAHAFIDANGNGAYDPGESPMAGAGLGLERQTVPVGACTTDALGACEFAGLPAGTYTLKSQSPSGYVSTLPAVDVPVSAGATTLIAVPFVLAPPTLTATLTETPTPTASPSATASPTATLTPTRTYQVWLPLLVVEQ